jgi:mono/diheme cytochrome c family protein
MVGWVIGCSAAFAADKEMDPSKLPPPAPVQVDFDRDIKPIFQSHCYRCHGPERPKSHFELDNPKTALKGGDEGIDIVPGNSAKSPLLFYVARLVPDMEMPPPGKGEPLTREQVSLLRAWIDQGAKWPETGVAKTKTLFSVEPSFAWIGVSGNKAAFREQWELKEGWSGGAQNFRVEERTPDGLKLDAEGRALAQQNDYRLKLNLEKQDLGFVRFGFEQFREYYNDTGGFYEPFGASALSLNRNLYLDDGRASFDLGLTLPNWPRIVLGYEYQYRQGSKSDLAWSDLSSLTSTNVAAIFPAYKDLNEQTHIIKLDVTHDIRGVHLEDSFRTELYTLNSSRVEYFPTMVGTAPSGLNQYKEDYSHFQAVNTFRLEKQVTDWLFLGGGYLYSRLDGDSGFTAQSFQLPGPIPVVPAIDGSSPIVIERESHLWNLSSLWGPWEGLTLTAGLQNEWTHEDGFGQGLVLFPGQPQHLYSSQRHYGILEEDAGLRYTKIPFTVLFTDARFRQEWIDLYDANQNSTDGSDFLVSNDAQNDLKDVRTGFTISPWTPVSLEASYRRSFERTDYNHELDTLPVIAGPLINPGNGYPAFFRRRDIASDDVDARLVLRPANWVKTTLEYQLVTTDFRTATDPSKVVPSSLFPLGASLPGGMLLSGYYDASIYSLSTTLLPWRRLNFSTTFSYTDSRTVSGVNGRAGVVPYEGNIYSVLSTANFIVSQCTDWNVSYTFSRADYRQNNEAESLPLGVEYNRHGVMTGLSRRFGKKISASLQYGFFYYVEPTSGGANDYTAHAVFGSFKVIFD